MELPYELKILPPQAFDVLLFLNQQEHGQADAITICEGAGLSDRAFGKAIRRLVTRNYLSMDMAGEYHLTPEGRKASQIIAQVKAEETGQPNASAQGPETVPRRLTAVVPQTLGVGSPAQLYVGVDAPQGPGLKEATALVLRLEGVNCAVAPPEHTLEVPSDGAAVPATFTLTAARAGQVRVRVRAYQLVNLDQVEDVGGMYFDARADDTHSAELQAIGINLDLYNE